MSEPKIAQSTFSLFSPKSIGFFSTLPFTQNKESDIAVSGNDCRICWYDHQKIPFNVQRKSLPMKRTIVPARTYNRQQQQHFAAIKRKASSSITTKYEYTESDDEEDDDDEEKVKEQEEEDHHQKDDDDDEDDSSPPPKQPPKKNGESWKLDDDFEKFVKSRNENWAKFQKQTLLSSSIPKTKPTTTATFTKPHKKKRQQPQPKKRKITNNDCGGDEREGGVIEEFEIIQGRMLMTGTMSKEDIERIEIVIPPPPPSPSSSTAIKKEDDNEEEEEEVEEEDWSVASDNNNNDNPATTAMAATAAAEDQIHYKFMGCFCGWECVDAFDEEHCGGAHKQLILLARCDFDGIPTIHPLLRNPPPQVMEMYSPGSGITLEKYRNWHHGGGSGFDTIGVKQCSFEFPKTSHSVTLLNDELPLTRWMRIGKQKEKWKGEFEQRRKIAELEKDMSAEVANRMNSSSSPSTSTTSTTSTSSTMLPPISKRISTVASSRQNIKVTQMGARVNQRRIDEEGLRSSGCGILSIGFINASSSSSSTQPPPVIMPTTPTSSTQTILPTTTSTTIRKRKTLTPAQLQKEVEKQKEREELQRMIESGMVPSKPLLKGGTKSKYILKKEQQQRLLRAIV